MTTNFPAQSRPPPAVPPAPNIFRAPRRTLSTVKPEPPQARRRGSVDVYQIEAEDDGRAQKRRKIESPRTEPQARTPVRPAQDEAAVTNARSPSPSRPSRVVRDVPEQGLLDTDAEDSDADTKPPLPFPVRPWKSALMVKSTFEEHKCGGRVRKNLPVPNTPDKLEAPRSALKFGKRVGKCSLAGFFPWTGKHPEDVLNENTAKHGYYDRAPSQVDKEQDTAKTRLHPPFKHRHGLHMLSEIFSAVLEKRGGHGKIGSGSTFKPPPRVTLTETKRKSWLADLANVEISLRRLSKTIPQGIRGQALLDQCLSNAVPISRAIWFVKCVGANEIRTLKRAKPTGNMVACHESKWLKDWTSNVEHFVEAAVQRCGQPNWRKNIQYVLRLCTRMYMDNLLDRDHYLDWMVRSLAAADVNQTPFWLMVIHIYSRDLIRFRIRGKKLAEALLGKICLLRTTNEEILQPLISRLRDVVRKLVIARPLCFLIPDQWPQSRETLRYCLSSASEAEQQLLSHLERINERTLGSNRLLHESQVSNQQDLVDILDAAKAPFNFTALSDSCKAACEDEADLISTVIEWATTRFRHSRSRMYVAVRLLRRWYRLGYNVEAQVLEFVSRAQQDCNPSIEQERFCHLILELSRSKTFSVSRYMQWLSIKGGMAKDCFDQNGWKEDVKSLTNDGPVRPQKCNDTSQLLTEISTEHLDDHVRNLRNITLSRAGYELAWEAYVVENCKTHLSSLLPTITRSSQLPSTDSNAQEPEFASLPWSTKSAIAHWLRGQVVAYFKTSKNPKMVQGASGTIALDVHELCVVRGVLEQMGDIAVLADVVAAFSTSTQEDILAAVADTVYYHSEPFSAIGAFDDLQRSLCHTYVALKAVRRSMPLLATSLIALCKQYPSKVVSVRTMQGDLRRGDRVRAVAAFSPFSDGVAESLQQAGETFLEEFEVILQSESNMSEETMHRLFGVLTERISKTCDEEDGHDIEFSLCQLLARLRLHRHTQCDRLVEAWLVRLLSENHSGTFALLTCMVGTSCLSFDLIAQAIKKVLSNKSRRSHSLAQTLSDLLSFKDIGTLRTSVQYRLSVSRSKFAKEKPLEMLMLASEVTSVLGLDLNLTRILPGLLLSIVLNGQLSTPPGPNLTSEMVASGLDLILDSPSKDADEIAHLYSIAASADDISLPFCQARMRLLLEKARSDTSKLEEMATGFFALADTEFMKSETTKVSCFSLLQSGSPEISCRVRQVAEAAFFEALPPLLQPKSFVPQANHTPQSQFAAAQRYLNIAFSASQGMKEASSTSSTSQLVDKFSTFHRILGSISASAAMTTSPAALPVPTVQVSTSPQATTTPTAVPEHLATLLRYFQLLLQMTCLQRPLSAINSNATAMKQAQQDQVKILVLLVSIALHPLLSEDSPSQGNSELVDFALDVATTLVDDLSDEARMLCARFLKDKMQDPRVHFLFGSVNAMGSMMSQEPGEGLRMVKGGVVMGEWRPKQWEVLEGAAEPWVGLGMFGAREGKV